MSNVEVTDVPAVLDAPVLKTEQAEVEKAFGDAHNDGTVLDAENVVYTGQATIRNLRSADWEKVGAGPRPDVQWNFKNNFKVPVSQFSPEQLAYLRIDGRFSVPGGN